MSGRRFLWRWSIRVLRRQWRQHVVIVALITVAVALSVGSVVAAFNLAAPPEHRFGTGAVRATVVGDITGAADSLQRQGHPFGSIGSITVDAAGSARRIEVRSQDPANPVVAPLLRLVDGRWPAGSGELAVTDDAPTPTTTLGASIDLAGSPRRIVGLVENPTDLADEFVLAPSLDGFGVEVARRATTFLVDGPPADVTFPAGSGSITVEGREAAIDDRTQIAIAVNLVAAVAMFEVALLVGAGFAVLARRRARQFGLLAAAGATPRQVRQAAAATGLVIGLVGAAIGAVVGVVVASGFVPRMEATVGHRIDLAVPWWSIGPTVVLAIGIAGLGAWWPARSLSTEPVVNTLAALRPQASSTRGSTTLGVGGLAAGGAVLAIGAAQLRASLMTFGIVVSLVGLLLLGPALIRLIGRWSAVLPLPARLAGRAVARQQGRSAAVVAALTLALGLPVGLAVVTASIDGHDRTKAPNVDERTALVWLPRAEQPEQVIPADLDAEAAAPAIARVGDAVARAAGAAVVPIQVAVPPDSRPTQFTFERLGPTLATNPVFGIRPADEGCLDLCEENTLGDRDENGDEILVTFHDAWIATPGLIDALGVDPEPSSGSAQALSRHADAKLSTHRDQSPEFPSDIANAGDLPPFTSLAPTLVWPDMVAASGWEAVTVGWLFTADDPLEAELREAMRAAAGSELLVEFIEVPSPRTGVRAAGIGAGIVISLGIVASAVGLLVSESAEDLRILRSVGAGPRTARWLSASTAAILAAAGAVIAIPTGYLALAVLMANPRGNFGFVVPLGSLASILVLVPLLAGGLGWVAIGRERPRARLGRPVAAVAALLAAALFGAACGGARSPVAAEPFDDTVGCDPAMERAIDAWADRGVGASIALFSEERTCVGGYGLADFSTGRANTSDTVFSIGSVTKAVTAAAVFDLIDDGVLTLDDRVAAHVAGLGEGVGALTIRDLLLHTSGLAGEHGVDHEPLSESEAIRSIAGLELAFDAGTAYSYANANYTLLALVVEAVSDQGYRHYLVDNILLDRAGGSIGGFWDGDPAAEGPRAFGYRFDETVSAQRGQFAGPHWALDGNGGVAMTVVEMAEWTWSLFNERILSPEATDLFLSTTTVLAGQTELAGWGWFPPKQFGEPVYATSGGGGSIGHLMNTAWLPESNRVIVIAENAADYDVPFFSGDIVPAILAGTGIPTPPTIPLADPGELAAAVGTYRVGERGRITISERDGGLLIAPVGVEAVEAVLPVPTAATPLIDLHEEHTRAFVDGETPEGRRFLDRIEAERGPLRSAEVLGTAFEGELGTYVELAFDGDTGLLVAGFNTEGGTEYFSTDAWPVLWYVVQPDGAFEMWQRPQDQPTVRLAPTAAGLHIDQDGRSIDAPAVD